MYNPGNNSFIFRKCSLQESYIVGWIILVIKSTLCIDRCIALYDSYDIQQTKYADVHKEYKNMPSVPEAPSHLGLIILWCDMLVYLLEMMMSFSLVKGIAKKNWCLVRMFYYVYPFPLIANILITGVRVAKANPVSKYINSLALVTLPNERTTHCLTIVFTFFEMYGISVARNCYSEDRQQNKDDPFTRTLPDYGMQPVHNMPPNYPMQRRPRSREPVYN